MMATITCLVFFLCGAQGFQPFPKSSSNSNTFLEARRLKRESLKSIVDDGMISTPKKTKKSLAKTTGRKQSIKSEISSDLAKWAASQGTSSKDGQPLDSLRDSNKSRTVATKGNKRVGYKEEEIRQIIMDLENELEGKKNNLEEILQYIQKLIQFESTPLKVLTSGTATSSNLNYRLAWVGSDAAICHVGTSQHKVPLARLQEIFLTLNGKNRLQLYEVISVLGPFPNIRNTLKGSCQVSGNDPYEWNIVYDSMIDGLGKELLANKEEQRQRVDLEVHFCDRNALVAVLPPNDEETQSNPLASNGANVLLFIREDDMDGKLEAMRVL